MARRQRTIGTGVPEHRRICAVYPLAFIKTDVLITNLNQELSNPYGVYGRERKLKVEISVHVIAAHYFAMRDKETNYIADFSLWLVTRRHRFENGKDWIEPTWVGCEQRSGPLLFVSPVAAEIFRQCRNTRPSDDPKESQNWQVLPLSKFDLYQHVLDCKGKLDCMLSFGFSATLAGELAGELVAPSGCPRSIHVPLPFELEQGSVRPTFSFNAWVFDFMREQWKIIGAHDYPHELEELSELDEGAIRELAKDAIDKIGFATYEPDLSDWGVFAPRTREWKFGPGEDRQNKVKFH